MGGVVVGGPRIVRLVELGPRMTLRLVKVEEGLLDGEVLHHEFVEKTDEEKKIIKEKKEKEREDNKAKSLEGMKKKEEKEKSWQGEKVAEFQKEQAELSEAVETEKYESSDDDEAYYEKEVGKKPERDLFSGSEKGKVFTGGKRFDKKKHGTGKSFKGKE